MTYIEAQAIVDGALDQDETFTDYALLEAWIREQAAEADADGLTTEIYTLRHDHELTDEECACVQYLTSHKPDYVFPGDDAPEEDEHPYA